MTGEIAERARKIGGITLRSISGHFGAGVIPRFRRCLRVGI